MTPGTGAVLAGGLSRRFGSDKALAPWGAGVLVEAALERVSRSFTETLLVVKDPGRFASLARPGVRLVRDSLALAHPLTGLAAALEAAGSPHAFVCACDMPSLREGLAARLWELRAGWDAVVPVWDGKPQPLCAVYGKACLPHALRLAATPGARARDLLALVRARRVEPREFGAADPLGRSFLDLDTRPQYERALQEAAC